MLITDLLQSKRLGKKYERQNDCNSFAARSDRDGYERAELFHQLQNNVYSYITRNTPNESIAERFHWML